ncbi:hypothetical protein KSP35_03665 [Aquihabitans sp. G128]|uniref:hypothetical protein n=1 Tax=Aquihabitans sp. G128 TaxID=2849779 RepID=UPI001C217143|nr:hypothetical protein [Aquihabitans sp. G128]QXC61931.1 hypothetical protein KSP35_03665 [Aquihabitans sp. G128]
MPIKTAPEPEVDQPMGMYWKLWRAVAVVAALAIAVFWIWIFAGGPKKVNPDRLDDRAYVSRAEDRCQQLLTDLDALTPASEAKTATERADVLDQANGLVRAMVDDIEAGAPTTGDDGKSLRLWFTDWHRYLGDRDDYAQALRTDPDAKFLLTENEELRDSVDKTIEVFADVNDMPDCATPGDVG